VRLSSSTLSTRFTAARSLRFNRNSAILRTSLNGQVWPKAGCLVSATECSFQTFTSDHGFADVILIPFSRQQGVSVSRVPAPMLSATAIARHHSFQLDSIHEADSLLPLDGAN
jgi:hypothetical protein